jgi:hypothetical protein
MISKPLFNGDLALCNTVALVCTLRAPLIGSLQKRGEVLLLDFGYLDILFFLSALIALKSAHDGCGARRCPPRNAHCLGRQSTGFVFTGAYGARILLLGKASWIVHDDEAYIILMTEVVAH